MALALRLRSRLGEPAHGVILRLASRHHEPCVRTFAKDIGLSLDRLLAGHEAERLAKLAGVNAAELLRYTPKIDVRSRTVELAGELLLLNDWSTRSRRWCSRCLVDDRAEAIAQSQPIGAGPWHRAHWDIRSVSGCARHGIRLSRACSRCGAEQDWSGPAVDRCRCGRDLCMSPNEPDKGPFAEYVESRLHLMEPHPLVLVDNLSLKDALSTIERLGQCALLGYRPHKPRTTNEENARARNLGVGIARHWPQAFLEILDRIVTEANANGSPKGIIGSYGWVYGEWAAGPLPIVLADALRPIIRGHAVARGVIGKGEALFGAETLTPMTITGAARELGLGYERARRLFESDELIPIGTRRGVAGVLPADRIEALKLQLADTIDAVSVGLRLGTAKAQTTAILATGLLVPIGGAKPAHYRSSDVAVLLERLAGNLPLLPTTPKSLVALPHACRAKGVKIAVAVKAIFNGDLAVDARLADARGLQQLLIQACVLNRFQAGKTLSIEAAAKQLAVHPEAVRQLVQAGAILTTKKCRRGSILPSEVQRFSRKYVPAAIIARELHISPRAAIKRLALLGISPAFGPPKFRQALFLRASIVAESLTF